MYFLSYGLLKTSINQSIKTSITEFVPRIWENEDTLHGLLGIQQTLRIHSPRFLSSVELKITKQSRRPSRDL